jgi:hypothetical protein
MPVINFGAVRERSSRIKLIITAKACLECLGRHTNPRYDVKMTGQRRKRHDKTKVRETWLDIDGYDEWVKVTI